MRISDWSSDVCSSNLSARPCATAYTTSPSSWALPPSSPCAALVRSSAPPMATSAARRADDEPLGEPMDAATLKTELAASSYQDDGAGVRPGRSEEHTSELQSLMRISYAVLCLTKTITKPKTHIKRRPPPTK